MTGTPRLRGLRVRLLCAMVGCFAAGYAYQLPVKPMGPAMSRQARASARSRLLRAALHSTPDHNDYGCGRRAWFSRATAAATGVAGALGGPRVVLGEGEEEGVGAAGEPVEPVKPLFAEDFPLDATLPYKGKGLPLKRLLGGKATLVVNVKNDDPEAAKQYPALKYLSEKYGKQGLRVLAVPTDQGWFEPEVSEIVRVRALQSYGFGQFPVAVVLDKTDIVGGTAHPLYKYLSSHIKNPNGRASVTLNFEKFLLDESGRPVRRYPRKYSGYEMESDVASLVNSEELGAPPAAFAEAWTAAEREAVKSEYAFRQGYNVYKQETASTDWQGIGDEGFR